MHEFLRGHDPKSSEPQQPQPSDMSDLDSLEVNIISGIPLGSHPLQAVRNVRPVLDSPNVKARGTSDEHGVQGIVEGFKALTAEIQESPACRCSVD